MDYFNWNQEYGSSTQHNSQPVYTPRKNSFAIASCICGILALITICTGVLPLIFGPLSIIFAVLSHRKGRDMENTAVAGFTLSVIALILITIMMCTVLRMLPAMMQEPAFAKQMNVTAQQLFGTDFDTMLEPFYDIGLMERTGE